MKTKIDMPYIVWRGIRREPEIVITKNRVTSHVRWSIYTMDVDHVLSEELARLLNIDDGKLCKELSDLFRSVREDKSANRKACQWSSGRWGGARFVPHAHAVKLAEFVKEKYIAAMEYCARNQNKILKSWGEDLSNRRKSTAP